MPINPSLVPASTASLVIPTSLDLIDQLEMKDGRYNGYASLLDAFLALLPETAKQPANDDQIERLYREIKCALQAPSRPQYQESQAHWAS